MPTSLPIDRHLAAIEAAGSRLAQLAESVGYSAEVPTCPSWDVRALVAHQTMVHRWATANVAGTDPEKELSQTEIRTSVDDLVTYYRQGLDGLLAALRAAPVDLQAMTFLKDAPPPRQFWARRQAHETTIHMVDCLSAELGRTPTSNEAAIDQALALDGIDELLAGFFTRGKSKLYEGTEFTILVAPDDGDRQWPVQVGERLTLADAPSPSPDLTITGTAAAVYLGLWNRGNELVLRGDPSIIDRWRETQQVRWR